MILLQACGCDGFGAPVAEDEFQEDGGRRANEETPFANLRQIHLRMGYGEPVELAPHPFMVIQAKGDVIDRLAGPVDRAALTRNEVYDRPAIGVEPVAGKGESRAVADLEPKDGFEKPLGALKVLRPQRYVVENGVLKVGAAAVEPWSRAGG